MLSIREKAEKLYQLNFGSPTKALLVRSPGRINLIGEHVDYNDGFVLPAAINKAVFMCIGLRNDDEIRLVAGDLNETIVVRYEELDPAKCKGWSGYILGVVAQFLKTNLPVQGFNAVIVSDIPIGAGLSSSAAIGCATVFGLNELLATNLNKITMIRMAQKAEHEYAGVMCGIMDQFACMMGKANHFIKLDCRSLQYEYVPLYFENTRIVLFNSNVKHTLAASEYNIRKTECDAAVELIRMKDPKVKTLRDAKINMLNDFVMNANSKAYKRAQFVIEEMQRVVEACDDLQKGKIESLGKKMLLTHYGLQYKYEVSCDELDFLVQQVSNKKEAYGARMMGGGFGGCTINLIHADSTEKVFAELKTAYESFWDYSLDCYSVSIEDGTEVLKKYA